MNKKIKISGSKYSGVNLFTVLTLHSRGVCVFLCEHVLIFWGILWGNYLTFQGGKKCCNSSGRMPGWVQSCSGHILPGPPI